MDNTSKFSNNIEKVFACMYCFFFVAQIMSPYINGKTIYIEWFIALFNPYFWKWLAPINVTYRKIGLLILLSLICLLGHPITAVKILMNIYSAIILMYLWEKKIWYVNVFVYISVVVSVLQLVLMPVDMELARMLGPTNISKTIWGDYATDTWTNLYDAMGFGIPRASGLSREAGFFASLLVVCVIHRVISKEHQLNFKLANLFYLIGYVTSFSKMSLAIIPVYIVIKFKKFINKIPSLYWVAIFIGVMMCIWGNCTDYLNDIRNASFLSRFGSYSSLWNMQIDQLLIGEEDLLKIDGIVAKNAYYIESVQAGLGAWCIYNGIIVMLLFLSILYFLGFNSTAVMIMMFLTINVQPDTNQNFVVYTWFLCMRYFSSYRWWENCEYCNYK